jgi:diguanylate cyclase (GGDEF)-like protein
VIRLLSLPLIITSSVSLVVGGFFLMLYGRLRSRHDEAVRHYRVFALLALVSGTFLGAFSVVLNSEDNLDRLDLANRVVVITAMFTIVLAVHFYEAFFGYRPPVPMSWLYAVNVFFSLLSLFPNRFFLAKETYRTSSYYTGLVFGPAFQAWGAWVIVASLYGLLVLVLFYRRMRRSDSGPSRGPVVALIGATGIWLLAGIADMVTALQVIDLPPLAWTGGFLVTLCIAWLLTVQIDTLYQEKRRLHDRLIRDHLTGVFSRSFFELRLAEAVSLLQRGGLGGVYVCVLDVDDFKAVNDRFGHTTGDAVLRQIGETLQRCIRGVDCAARLGGDEFAVLFPGVPDDATALAVVERIRASIVQQRFLGDAASEPVSCSFGTVGARIEHARETGLADRLLTEADDALYRSKRKGKNAVTVVPLGTSSAAR